MLLQAELGEGGGDVDMKRAREDAAGEEGEAGLGGSAAAMGEADGDGSMEEGGSDAAAAAGGNADPQQQQEAGGGFIGPAMRPGGGGAAGAAGASGGADHDSFRERAKYIPLRLNMEERRLLRLLEAALSVSEYTGGCRVGLQGAWACSAFLWAVRLGVAQHLIVSHTPACMLLAKSIHCFRHPALLSCVSAVPGCPPGADKVDVVSWKKKSGRVHAQIKDMCAILCGEWQSGRVGDPDLEPFES